MTLGEQAPTTTVFTPSLISLSIRARPSAPQRQSVRLALHGHLTADHFGKGLYIEGISDAATCA